MKIYLAGPIDGCTDDEASDWREYVKSRLGNDMCLDPMARDYRGREVSNYQEIVEYDLNDIDKSDLVLANCWKAGWGTPMEIMYAYLNSIPVIAVVPDIATASPWLRYHAEHLRDNLGKVICDIEAGIYG